jgi:hypothetical protein
MAIQGTGLHDKNARLRFLMYIFLGVIAFGSVLYWRTHLMTNSEYVEFGVVKKSNANKGEGTLRSQRYQIETLDSNPTVN